MLKLSKYLKPFIPIIFLSIVLLFVQSIAELMLPNRMSDIVNVGLQQSGIEHASPDAISPESFERITALLSDEDREFITGTMYAPVSRNDTDRNGRTYISLYPNMNETVYVRRDRTGRFDEDTVLSGYPHARDQRADEIFETAAYVPPTDSASQTEEDTATIRKQAGALQAKDFYEELGADVAAMQSGYILKAGLFMLLISLVSAAAAIGVGYFAPRVAAGASRNLRRDIFAKVEDFSHHELDKFSSASLITRCTNDVQQVQMLVGMGIRMLCLAPIMGVGGIIMALGKAPSMSWIIALAVIVLIGLVVLVSMVALPKFKIIQKLIDGLNKISRETLSGLMVIRAFGTQKYETDRFDGANLELSGASLFVGRVMALISPLITFIMSGTSLLIIWVGARQISDSGMQIGDMMAFMQYATQVIMAFMMLSMMTIMIPRAAVSGERIAEVLAEEYSITDPDVPESFDPSKKGLVEFKSVSFHYDNAENAALSDISFTARPGQTTAIIGATGSGKTTIANLLLRFYDVTGGAIFVDGADIRKVRRHDLRGIIGYVPQKGQLLTGTVASNIRYGRPIATDEEIAEAANVAQAADFIEEKEDKYDSEIAQSGTNVSGGQKQRLSIARALAKKPEILVFDDSFSALDFRTDAKLRKALKQRTSEATMIVIAQRVGTIMGAEQILVVDKGQIIGRGTHGELLKSCPEYSEIASSQLDSGLAKEAGANA